MLPHDSVAGLGWIEAEGPHADIVLSTRVRLARNLQGFRFGTRADPADRREVLRMARAAAEGSASLAGGRAYLIPDLPASERQLLLERHLVSRELVSGHGGEPPSDAALLTGVSEPVSVMVNEEDHLRLQTLLGGFRLQDAWREIDRLDDDLGGRLPYAYHNEFGYLTSCPTNVGTGLRASVLMHLPGLVLTQEISKVLQGIGQVGLTFAGCTARGARWWATSSRSPTRRRWGRRRRN
jgi:protein arginine kinase